MIDDIADSIVKLVKEKNERYGSSYNKTREEYGQVSFIIRLKDKVNRLNELIRNEDLDSGDESIEDTIKDVIGYCLLELDYIDKKETIAWCSTEFKSNDIMEFFNTHCATQLHKNKERKINLLDTVEELSSLLEGCYDFAIQYKDMVGYCIVLYCEQGIDMDDMEYLNERFNNVVEGDERIDIIISPNIITWSYWVDYFKRMKCQYPTFNWEMCYDIIDGWTIEVIGEGYRIKELFMNLIDYDCELDIDIDINICDEDEKLMIIYGRDGKKIGKVPDIDENVDEE